MTGFHKLFLLKGIMLYGYLEDCAGNYKHTINLVFVINRIARTTHTCILFYVISLYNFPAFDYFVMPLPELSFSRTSRNVHLMMLTTMLLKCLLLLFLF